MESDWGIVAGHFCMTRESVRLSAHGRNQKRLAPAFQKQLLEGSPVKKTNVGVLYHAVRTCLESCRTNEQPKMRTRIGNYSAKGLDLSLRHT
jgi:hypothetical protein